MKRGRRGFTVVEWLVISVVALVLIAIIESTMQTTHCRFGTRSSTYVYASDRIEPKI